ncbi:MAG: hypothetical protein IPI59_03665 [Sphingobacteriales bacterium]|nr:hypothetical protein [Sphingobacteriales bacterium]MBK6890297.1 hypothetical protein [Sphingobacteriales bacterium]MBK7526654.1 hypothetical protein [Sphingobacteriales bacterium]MBK8678487.1 hypothetical protein [Sphingobacteriales bacterium]
MMKVLMLFLTVLFMNYSFASSVIDEARMNYNKAVQDKDLCRKMIDELEKSKEKSPVYLAYLGGFQTIWANHVFNPISKLQSFKEGKNKIEQAISKEPDNVEIRFIRFSVQKNAPSFLGYSNNIIDDRNFIIKNRDDVSSEVVQKNIEILLK